MDYVYDSSFIGALIIPDEQNPQIDRSHAKVAEEADIFVPSLIWYEMGNILKNLVRRGRYTYDEVLGFLPKLAVLRLTGDEAGGSGHTETLLRLARDYGLTTYDAAYLELAGRKKAVLCTLDDALRRAAERYGVVVLR